MTEYITTRPTGKGQKTANSGRKLGTPNKLRDFTISTQDIASIKLTDGRTIVMNPSTQFSINS